MMSPCEVYCPICRQPFDWWLRGYGRECRCCCKECHDEFEWRRSNAILGKTPDKTWAQKLLEANP